MSTQRHSHEQTDLEPKYIVYFAVGLTLLIAATCVGVWWMFRQFEREHAGRQPAPPPVQVQASIPAPRLQIDPQCDLQELRRQEEKILSTYAWVDREKGIARIPVDRAIQLFLERQKK